MGNLQEELSRKLDREHESDKLSAIRQEENRNTALYQQGDKVFTRSGEATVIDVSDIHDHYLVRLHDKFKTVCTRQILHKVE